MSFKKIALGVIAAASVATVAMVAPNSVTSGSVVDGSLYQRDLNNEVAANFLDRRPVVYTATLVEPEVVTTVGGPIQTGVTKLPTAITLQPGTYLVEVSAQFQRTVAAAAGDPVVRPQVSMWLDKDGNDEYNWNDGEAVYKAASPSTVLPVVANRHASVSTQSRVTVTEPTKIQVGAFAYADDQSSTGSGQFAVTSATLTALRFG